jgi:hypothetical protein
MVRLLADENFNGRIVRALLLGTHGLDLVRVPDVGLSGADDQRVLEWAAKEGRVLLTHDHKTIPKHAYERVAAGLAMPGVFVADPYLAVQQAVEDILLIVECSEQNEWAGQVRYLPLSIN